MYLVTVEELGEIMIMVEGSKLSKVADSGESGLEE